MINHHSERDYGLGTKLLSLGLGLSFALAGLFGCASKSNKSVLAQTESKQQKNASQEAMLPLADMIKKARPDEPLVFIAEAGYEDKAVDLLNSREVMAAIKQRKTKSILVVASEEPQAYLIADGIKPILASGNGARLIGAKYVTIALEPSFKGISFNLNIWTGSLSNCFIPDRQIADARCCCESGNGLIKNHDKFPMDPEQPVRHPQMVSGRLPKVLPSVP
ncbi:MAG: hypothetical protein PHY92_01895 [Alphaproteobacteria bacterium]|nr:hypothetical protein [Alphaproteobacteria bacterium]